MNTIIKQISGCVFIFAMMFVLLQSTQTNLHARTRGPVVVKPYDEESKKMIKEEFRQIITNNERLNRDLKSLKGAAETYSEAPTPLNEAELMEKTGKFLNTAAGTVCRTKESIVRVTPEIRKFTAHYENIINDLKNRGETGIHSDVARGLNKELSEFNNLLVHLERTDEYLKEISRDLLTVLKLHYEKGSVSQAVETIFEINSPGELSEAMGEMLEDINGKD